MSTWCDDSLVWTSTLKTNSHVCLSPSEQFSRLQTYLPLPPQLFSQLTQLPGPLTQVVKRALTITNHNAQPVAFKVKTTAPKVPSRSLIPYPILFRRDSFTVSVPTLVELNPGRASRSSVRLPSLLITPMFIGTISHATSSPGGAAVECQVQRQVSHPKHPHYCGEGDHASPGHRTSYTAFSRPSSFHLLHNSGHHRKRVKRGRSISKS